MNIKDYKKVKAYDKIHHTENVKVLKVNNRPMLRFKQHNPDTGVDLGCEGEGVIDIVALELHILNLQEEMDSVKALVKDAKALTPTP